MYLGLQVVGVFVIEPDLGVVAVGDAVGGDPVLLVPPSLGDQTRHQTGGTQVQLQPLVLCKQQHHTPSLTSQQPTIRSLRTPATAGVDVTF